VYIDLAKAFDTVSHEKLLYRLKSYGIDGNLLSWLRNFLVGRTHCTLVNNCMSETCDLRSGVIQGSTIGPLLFISFINELADLLGPMIVTSKLFADDLEVYAEVLTTIDRNCFQLALDRIAAWCSHWQLQIAIKKCCLLRIGLIPTGIDLYINGNQLPEVSTAKDLGIRAFHRGGMKTNCLQFRSRGKLPPGFSHLSWED